MTGADMNIGIKSEVLKMTRVTGYLVKKSEIDKLTHGEQSINNCTIFGKGAKERGHALERKVYGKDTN